jgi:hypothetical protein
MLSRMNLTLSALALSNRLNLGTRSFAANASVNFGVQTLRTRQSHHDVMRERMDWYVVLSMPRPRYAIPAIPSSFFSEQQCPTSCVTLQQGCVAVDVPVEPEPRPADLVGRPEPCVYDRGLYTLTTSSTTWSTAPDTTSLRLLESAKSSAKHGFKRTARRAAKAAARRSATSGK